MHVTFDHTVVEARDIQTFWFKPERPIRYVAGQYIELIIKHDHPDERGEKRWFTLSSAPGGDLVSITTRYAGENASSTFKRALFHLEPGTALTMSEPSGDFVLPKDPTRPLIWIAGGLGITPYHSMAAYLADRGETRTIRFIYAVRNEDEIIFEDTFQRAGIHMTIVVGNPSDAWGGERGRITTEMVLGITRPDEDTLVYLSGPEPMVENLGNTLKKTLGEQRLIQDFFPGYQDTYSTPA